MNLLKYKCGRCVRLTAVESKGLVGARLLSIAELTGKPIDQVIREHKPRQTVLLLTEVTATSITGTDIETLKEGISFSISAHRLRYKTRPGRIFEPCFYNSFFGWTVSSVGAREVKRLIKRRQRKLEAASQAAAEHMGAYNAGSKQLMKSLAAA